MKAAVVGLRFGELHLQSLQNIDDIEIVICDTNKKRLDKMSVKYDISSKTTSYEKIISDKTIDFITLAVPHHLHYEMIKKGLDKNKHVYCEKPLTITFSEAEKLTKLAEEKGLQLTVGFNMRFYKQYQQAYSLINEGKLGEIMAVDCFTRADVREMNGFRLSKEKSGGGCLIDAGIHRFDLLRWLIGPVNSVYTRGGNYVIEEIESEDIAVVSLGFNNEIIGNLNCIWGVHVPTWDDGLKIYGKKGTLEIWDNNLSLTWRKADGISHTYKYNVSYEETVGLSLAAFINNIKEESTIDKIKNLAHMQIVEAAYKSLEKDLPVKIKNPV